MPRTRAFKSGNSQAVRIPAELAYADTDVDLEINRLGDIITIFPEFFARWTKPIKVSTIEGCSPRAAVPFLMRIWAAAPITVQTRTISRGLV